MMILSDLKLLCFNTFLPHLLYYIFAKISNGVRRFTKTGPRLKKSQRGASRYYLVDFTPNLTQNSEVCFIVTWSKMLLKTS